MTEDPLTGTGLPPFSVRDCAHTALATGIHAEDLKELRDGLARAPLGSLYQHFWARLLRPQFDEPEYNNDFASWAYHGLHDKVLAERLAVIDPAGFEGLESLRQEVIEVLEERLDDGPSASWSNADQPFFFVQSQIVVFDTGLRLSSPSELASAVAELSTGSIFYHFIDARRRTPDRRDDFALWLSAFGEPCASVAQELARVDPYFSSLKEVRRILADILGRHCGRETDQ
ncbi:MAG: hypothetical protein HY900_16510 [Deltaproteobacteria bacterium]|nr:hypothetical protein [Deltaproteobacteria bacterium]